MAVKLLFVSRLPIDRWTPEEAQLPNVILGLHLSLEHWTDLLWGLPVRSQLDNATAVAYCMSTTKAE